MIHITAKQLRYLANLVDIDTTGNKDDELYVTLMHSFDSVNDGETVYLHTASLELPTLSSQEIATALRLLDSLYDQAHKVATWLSGSTIAQDSYNAAKQQLEASLPGMIVLRLDLNFRSGHVIAPITE